MLKLIQCSACGLDASPAASACPHCGHPIRSQKSFQLSGNMGCGTVIVAVFFVAFMIALFNNTTNPKPNQTPAETQASIDEQMGLVACSVADDAVKEKLIAPASAEFPGCVFGANKYTIKSSDDRKEIIVLGYVDSQNAFGAKLRKKFGVKLARTGSGTMPGDFKVIDVQME